MRLGTVAVCIGVLAGSASYVLLRVVQQRSETARVKQQQQANDASGPASVQDRAKRTAYPPPPNTKGWPSTLLDSVQANPDEEARAALLDLSAVDQGEEAVGPRFLRAFDLLHRHEPATNANAEMNFATGYLLGKLGGTWNTKGPFPVEAEEIGYHAVRFAASKNELEQMSSARLLWMMLADPEPSRSAKLQKELVQAFGSLMASADVKFTLEGSIPAIVERRKELGRPALAKTSPDDLLR